MYLNSKSSIYIVSMKPACQQNDPVRTCRPCTTLGSATCMPCVSRLGLMVMLTLPCCCSCCSKLASIWTVWEKILGSSPLICIPPCPMLPVSWSWTFSSPCSTWAASVLSWIWPMLSVSDRDTGRMFCDWNSEGSMLITWPLAWLVLITFWMSGTLIMLICCWLWFAMSSSCSRDLLFFGRSGLRWPTMWLLRWPEVLNLKSQCGHLKGLAPVWRRMWTFRLPLVENREPQMWQLNFFMSEK